MAELIEDEIKGIRVATITNKHERIVRLVNKFNMALTIELMYLMPGQYQWMTESIGIGVEEMIEIGRLAQQIKDEIDKEESNANKQEH